MEIERYVQHQRRRLAQYDAARERLAADLRSRLPSLAAALAALGARRVVLFGSLATGHFRPDSDVDVAVGGLPRGRLVESMAAAEQVMHRPVDVVRIETASERLRAHIEADGEVILDD